MKIVLGMAVLVSFLCGHARGQAYLVDTNIDVLFTIDLATGAATPIASTANNGLTTPADLTWREDTGELWTIDFNDGQIGTIDTTTGTFTQVFHAGANGWQGMTWDPTTQRFYLSNQDGQVHRLDPATGVIQPLPLAGSFLVHASLDVDATGRLYGIDFFSGGVFIVDKDSGAATQLSKTIAGFQGLSYDEAGDRWLGANTDTDALYTIDPASGATTLVGAHGGGVAEAKGFEIAGDGFSSFCTAKGGLACGMPQIDATGIPSASATSGFVVSAGPARSCKSGVLLYNTTSLATGVPFQGGTLCVTPGGIRRAGPTNSQGTPGGASCDGEFALDMNAFAAGVWSVPDCSGQPSGLAANNPAGFLLLAGQDVYCQFWGRDSVATGSFLSAGVLYTVLP